MLSCGRGIGQISRFTRHAYPNCIKSAVFEFTGRIGSLRHASDGKIDKSGKQRGATLRAEECMPPKLSKTDTSAKNSGSCPPECEEICGKIPERGPGNDNNSPKYWKQIIAVILVAGVTIYTYTRIDSLRDKEGSASKNSSKKKKDSDKTGKARARYPVSSAALPADVPYLLIGGGTAAFSAFRSIKSKDPKAKVRRNPEMMKTIEQSGQKPQ
uniref:AIF protein n=1 Tax=Fopius arisanus TaxID=64838 RepID=A0A0C9QIS5_9HYME